MSAIQTCPVCSSSLPADRVEEEILICSECGWAQDLQQTEFDKMIVKKFRRDATILAALLVLLFIHFSQWNGYGLEIVPLQAKFTLKLSDGSDLEQFEEICRDLEKPQCVEDILQRWVQLQPSNLKKLGQYGKILAHNGKESQALEVFDRYFKKGGIQLETAYQYAKLLGEDGDVEEASRYFQFVLKAKPDMLQVTVTRSYVAMLVANNRLAEARKVIERAQRSGANTRQFMQIELNDIKKQLVAKK